MTPALGGDAPAFKGKGFIVTGGTRGIGRAIVLAALRDGADVIFCGRHARSREADEVLALGAGAIGQLHYVPCDVANEAEVEALFDFASREMKTPWAIVNNAGIVADALLVNTSLAQWNDVLRVNLRGPFLVMRRALSDFIFRRLPGRIINISSVIANGAVGQAAYAASKSALLSLTRTAAKEYGRRNILCNAIVAGYIDTDMVASLTSAQREARQGLSVSRRFGTAEEVANAVMFLASADASFVNGEALYVSGGVHDVPALR